MQPFVSSTRVILFLRRYCPVRLQSRLNDNGEGIVACMAAKERRKSDTIVIDAHS
jgi:hypothetical protein